MIRFQLSEIAVRLGCPVPDNDVAVDSIATDSRRVHHATLFAALPGNNVDGHDFASSAVDLGASALLLNRPLDLDVPQLIVNDVLLALGEIAALLRARLDPAVIGITGSNGKTTVKEMVASILCLDSAVLATQGNYNNELGVPLSLFGLNREHRYAVLEMGASKSGDISYLCQIANPDIGLITNIGPAHLKGFGTEKGVALAKGEIYATLPTDGCAVINADEPWSDMWTEMNSADSVLTFGSNPECDVQLLDRETQPRIRIPGGEFDLHLLLPGKHNQMNAAAAAAVAVALDIDAAAIARGLQAVRPVPGRLNLIKTDAGWTVIDDTYNANPASLYSALQVLAQMQGTPWLVLGDMKELGEDSRKMHREVGEAARAMGVGRLFTTGELSSFTSEAFGEGAEHFEDRDELAETLCSQLKPGTICLVKGSRSMGMEAIVQAITDASCMREAS
ncbi:UDP-N-acetylmuramoyl-tripeptide--D-alanyl-D-alanine ligase [Pseudomonadota bacterium]